MKKAREVLGDKAPAFSGNRADAKRGAGEMLEEGEELMGAWERGTGRNRRVVAERRTRV